MPPQLLSSVCPPGIKVTLSSTALQARPKIGLAIAECLEAWSWVETQTTMLYLVLCRANYEQAAAYFSSLESSKAKKDAIRIAAINKLSDDEVSIINALLRYTKAHQSIRDRIAHWIWAIPKDMPNAILLYDPKSLLRNKASFLAALATGLSYDDAEKIASPHKISRTEMYIYTEEALEKDCAAFKSLLDLITSVLVLCKSSLTDPTRAQRRDELTKDGRLAPFLSPSPSQGR